MTTFVSPDFANGSALDAAVKTALGLAQTALQPGDIPAQSVTEATITDGVLSTEFGGVHSVQLSENVTSWQAPFPTGATPLATLYQSEVTFYPPSSGGPFSVTFPYLWIQVGSAIDITLSPGDPPITVLLRNYGTEVAYSVIQTYKPALAIGELFQSGYYAGMLTYPDGVYGIILAPKARQTGSIAWKTEATDDVYPFSLLDGKSNTDWLMSQPDPTVYPAAYHCATCDEGGYTDWYMPAQYEMNLLYRAFKPTTLVNNTTTGENPYTVPPSSNFTAGTPPISVIEIFQNDNAQSMKVDGYNYAYWVSSEFTATTGKTLGLSGAISNRSKADSSSCLTRPIRRVKLY